MNQTTILKGNQKEGLTPQLSPWMEDVMSHSAIVNQLLTTYGSPINILHMTPFNNNISEFRSMFDSFDVDHKIYYARKANKCIAFPSQALKSGIGIDTASERELAESLSIGAKGKDLVLTSAIKTRPQIELAIENDVPIFLDNADECLLVNQIAQEKDSDPIVGFRISGFTVNNEKLYSRFGFDVNQITHFITSYVGQGRMYERLDLRGLHFHLNGYSIHERRVALTQTIGIAMILKAKGYPIQFIDIGGGILVNYLKYKEEWESFHARLKECLRQNQLPVTFQNNGLGYQVIDGKLTGSLNTYPFYNETSGADFLKKILKHKDTRGNSVASYLNRERIQLRIEPGRSLTDQCGITIARVTHRKQDVNGEWLVGLEMNMSQMMSSSADFLLDPYIIYQRKADTSGEITVYFTGAYCLEQDILLKRKIHLPSLPERDDLVIFVNTAGYMMHFFETEAHRFSLAQNLVFIKNGVELSKNDFIRDEEIDLNT